MKTPKPYYYTVAVRQVSKAGVVQQSVPYITAAAPITPIVYHGTDKTFKEFTDQPTWFYTKESPYAAEYATKSRTVAAKLNLNKPYITNDMEQILELPYHKSFIDDLKAKGYDSIYSPDYGMYVTFNPKQIMPQQ